MGKYSGGLSSREQYKIESSLLLRLSRADTPRECVGHRYFPSLVAANDTSAELTTSHDGLPIALQPKRQSVRHSLHTPTPSRTCIGSATSHSRYQRRNCSLNVCRSAQRCFATDICAIPAAELCSQARCIALILMNAGVQHSDIHGGKNIALKDGRLVLFDFDMSRLIGVNGKRLFNFFSNSTQNKLEGSQTEMTKWLSKDHQHMFNAIRGATADCFSVDGHHSSHDTIWRCPDDGQRVSAKESTLGSKFGATIADMGQNTRSSGRLGWERFSSSIYYFQP